MTKIILITDPGTLIRITNLDYRSGLRNTDRDNFGHVRFKMDQDLPHFTPTIFHVTFQPMTRQMRIWTECTLDEV